MRLQTVPFAYFKKSIDLLKKYKSTMSDEVKKTKNPRYSRLNAQNITTCL